MKVGARFFLGIGVSGTGCDVKILAQIRHVLAMAEIEYLDGIATIDKKAQHPLIIALAGAFKVPIVSFSPKELERQTPHLANPSAALFARLGCHGVAEAAALAAAGAGSTLLIPKTIYYSERTRKLTNLSVEKTNDNKKLQTLSFSDSEKDRVCKATFALAYNFT